MAKQENKQVPSGPIAQKIIRSAAKYTKNKIIDFKEWKCARAYREKLAQFHKEKDLSNLDPLHAIYMDMQHHVADFIELFSNASEARKLNQHFEKAEDIYMPSGPPMSPITQSYFTCWAAFDMCVGIKHETYATIMMNFCKSIGTHPDFIEVLNCMQQSRSGLYIVEDSDKKFTFLRELYTNKTIKTHVPSQSSGALGEIWLVRLLPDPTGQYCDYSVAFTTPYVIIDFPLGKRMPAHPSELMYSESEWLKFIERNLAQVKNKDRQEAYEHFMKYGLKKLYWLEYIFLAYVNHTPNMIWLTGFPDQPETLPHADDNDLL